MPITRQNIEDIKAQIKEYSTTFIKESLNIKLNTSKLDLIFEKYEPIRDNIKNHMLEPENGDAKRIDRVKVASIIAVAIIHVRPIEVKADRKISTKFEKYSNIYLAYHTALAILQDFSHFDKIGEHVIDSKLYKIKRPTDYQEKFRKLIVNNLDMIEDLNRLEKLQRLFFIIRIFDFIDYISLESYQEKYLNIAG